MKKQELSQASSYIGTCPHMCPEKERVLRFGSQVSIFERDEYSMVKEYRRAGADQEEPSPDDLRTPEALENTINHLVCNIMDDNRSLDKELALDWYDFLWDRLRAIRKDITQQNICDQASAMLVECCTRFHIHSCYAMTEVKDFDINMNRKNLNDCLQMLRQMYTDLRMIGITCVNEIEFQKYDILLHLDHDSLSTTVSMKTSDHRSSSDMKYIVQVFNAYISNDYYKFFQLMLNADYMTSCILSLYVNKIRLTAIKIIAAACISRQKVLYPADLIMETLAFDDLDDLRVFCSALEIEITEANDKHHLVLDRNSKNSFQLTNLPTFRSRCLVENKMMGKSVGQLVYGQPIELAVYRQPKVEVQEAVCVINPAPVEIKVDRSIGFFEEPMIVDSELTSERSPTEFGESKPKRKAMDDDEQMAPQIISAPEEVIGGSPKIEAKVAAIPKPDIAWFKFELPTDKSSIVKQAPKINNLKSVDVATYQVEAENPPSECESKPFVWIDRSVQPTNEPVVSKTEPVKVEETRILQVIPELSPERPTAQTTTETNVIEVEVDDNSTSPPPEDIFHPPKADYKRVVDMMPAGRFRRSKRMAVRQSPTLPPPKPSPVKNQSPSGGRAQKRFREEIDVNEMREKVFQEAKANESLLRLYNIIA